MTRNHGKLLTGPVIGMRKNPILRIVTDPAEFRQAIDDRSDAISELFPTDFAEGYRLKDFTRVRSTKFRITFFGLRS